MSYMRWPYYVWSDGVDMHISCVGDGPFPSVECSIPLEVFDELVAMRWTRLTPAERENTIGRAIANHAGCFGAEGVRKLAGLPTLMDTIKDAVGDQGK